LQSRNGSGGGASRQESNRNDGGQGGNKNSGGRGAGGNNQNTGDNAGKSNKRKAEGATATLEGCIVNRTGRNINFPSSLSQKYCSHFADTEKLCTFKERCKLSHASFPDGYAAQDVSPMLTFVKKTQGLGWHSTIKVPSQ